MITPINEENERILDALTARIAMPGGTAGFEKLSEQANHCSEPVRLHGRRTKLDSHTGEILEEDESDQLYLVSCGNRRASRCLSCADTYRHDARHLVLAGLKGGKGVPESVQGHPMAFVTLTAPSFGTVHRRAKAGGPCHPSSPNKRCEHERALSCFLRHDEDDNILGEPLCPECYRYTEHVLFHALSSELWRRTMIYSYRALARLCGTTPSELRSKVRLSFFRAVEYQARGAVHLHVVVRADRAGESVEPPPAEVTSELLVAAVVAGARAVRVPYPVPIDGRLRHARWGAQLDAVPIDSERSARRVAHYVSGYVSKSTESSGALDRRLKSSREVAALKSTHISEHQRRLVVCAWRLGGKRELRDLSLRRSAHQLGYAGHVISKSRHYSSTFRELRKVRHDHRLELAKDHCRRRGEHPDRILVSHTWRYVGTGHELPSDRVLSEFFASRRIASRNYEWLHGPEQR